MIQVLLCNDVQCWSIHHSVTQSQLLQHDSMILLFMVRIPHQLIDDVSHVFGFSLMNITSQLVSWIPISTPNRLCITAFFRACFTFSKRSMTSLCETAHVANSTTGTVGRSADVSLFLGLICEFITEVSVI